MIGDDETMARQAGINVPLAKVTIFVISSVFMTFVGAIMAPRFGYLTPHFAFNPLISFQVVIMALLGGMQRLWGPVLGVVPLDHRCPSCCRCDFRSGTACCSASFSWSSSISCRAASPGWSKTPGTLRRPIALPRGLTGPMIDAWAWLSRPMSLPRGIAGLIEDAWARLARRLPSGGR